MANSAYLGSISHARGYKSAFRNRRIIYRDLGQNDTNRYFHNIDGTDLGSITVDDSNCTDMAYNPKTGEYAELDSIQSPSQIRYYSTINAATPTQTLTYNSKQWEGITYLHKTNEIALINANGQFETYNWNDSGNTATPNRTETHSYGSPLCLDYNSATNEFISADAGVETIAIMDGDDLTIKNTITPGFDVNGAALDTKTKNLIIIDVNNSLIKIFDGYDTNTLVTSFSYNTNTIPNGIIVVYDQRRHPAYRNGLWNKQRFENEYLITRDNQNLGSTDDTTRHFHVGISGTQDTTVDGDQENIASITYDGNVGKYYELNSSGIIYEYDSPTDTVANGSFTLSSFNGTTTGIAVDSRRNQLIAGFSDGKIVITSLESVSVGTSNVEIENYNIGVVENGNLTTDGGLTVAIEDVAYDILNDRIIFAVWDGNVNNGGGTYIINGFGSISTYGRTTNDLSDSIGSLAVDVIQLDGSIIACQSGNTQITERWDPNDNSQIDSFAYLTTSPANGIVDIFDPIQQEPYIYAGDRNGNLYKLEPDGSGTQWSTTVFSGGANVDGIAPFGSYVYVVSGDDDILVQLDKGDGSVINTDVPIASAEINDVAVDGNGDVYVAVNDPNSTNDAVYKYGENLNQIWSSSGLNAEILSIAVDQQGYSYTSSISDDIIRIDPDGNVDWSITTPTTFYIIDLAVDENYLYCMGAGGQVAKFDKETNNQLEVFDTTNASDSIVTDGFEYIYFGNNNGGVQKAVIPTSQNDVYSSVWGQSSYGTDDYYVDIDANGFVYVVGGNHILKFNPYGDEIFNDTSILSGQTGNAVAVDRRDLSLPLEASLLEVTYLFDNTFNIKVSAVGGIPDYTVDILDETDTSVGSTTTSSGTTLNVTDSNNTDLIQSYTAKITDDQGSSQTSSPINPQQIFYASNGEWGRLNADFTKSLTVDTSTSGKFYIITDNDANVYVYGNNDPELISYDLNGNQRWTYNNHTNSINKAIKEGDYIYTASDDGGIHKIEAATGGNAVVSTIFSGTVNGVASDGTYLYGISSFDNEIKRMLLSNFGTEDTTDGFPISTVGWGENANDGSFEVANGKIYIASNSGDINAYNISDGSNVSGFPKSPEADNISGNNKIVFTSDGDFITAFNENLYRFDGSDGSTVWSTDLTNASDKLGFGIDQDNGLLYITENTSTNPTGWVIDVSDGSEIYSGTIARDVAINTVVISEGVREFTYPLVTDSMSFEDASWQQNQDYTDLNGVTEVTTKTEVTINDITSNYTSVIWEAGANGDGCALYIDDGTVYFQGGDGTGAGSGSSAVELSWTVPSTGTYVIETSYSQNNNAASLYIDGLRVDTGGPGDGSTLNAIAGSDAGGLDYIHSGLCDIRSSITEDFTVKNAFEDSVRHYIGEVQI